MRSRNMVVLPLVLFAVAVVAALPFRRENAPPISTPTSAGEDFRLRTYVPLQVPQPPQTSPAADLDEVVPPKSRASSAAQIRAPLDEPDRPPLQLSPFYRSLFPLNDDLRPDRDSWHARENHGGWRPESPPNRENRTIAITDGDTLAGLAERYLGSADLADVIYEANRHVLKRPGLLPLGAQIIIPGGTVRQSLSDAQPVPQEVKGQPLAPEGGIWKPVRRETGSATLHGVIHPAG